jgi:hypothetical protein
MEAIRVPVWTTYVPADEVDSMHAAEVEYLVNAIFEKMEWDRAPCDLQMIEQGDFGPALEPLRPSLTLFITAWCNLMSVYTSSGTDELVEFPERVIPAWKVRLVQDLFRKPKPSAAKVAYRPEA